MSHFTTLKTAITDKAYLIQALQSLGFRPEEGAVWVKGFSGKRTKVEVRIPSQAPDYDVGFRKEGKTYVCVADWFGVRGIEASPFLQQLSQRYAYCAALDKLKSQGFDLINEQHIDGQIHVTVRRMS